MRKTSKVRDLGLFLACDGRRPGDPNDLLNVMVNQILKYSLYLNTNRQAIIIFVKVNLYVILADLGLVARRANTALVFASPDPKN